MIHVPINILLVDDERDFVEMLSLRLTDAGHIVKKAFSGQEALAALAGGDEDAIPEVDVVILDIKMPGRSGIELLPEIRARHPDTAVIMATAVTEVGVAIECLKEGADDYICKPFNLEEVSLGVRRALDKRNLQLRIREYQQYLEQKVEDQTGEIRRLFLGAIESLVSALEAKDRYTGGHSRRVTEMALALGNELGLSPEEMEDLRWGSLLHDVGKIAVDQLIQNKPGRLTPEEYEHIMIHAHVGAGIVQPVVNERVVKMIEHHHDHYDGSGLHQVVAGSDIPLAARILAIADAYDAMTSDRPYRPAMSREQALEEIRRCMETQFDPVVAQAFLDIMTRKDRSAACPH